MNPFTTPDRLFISRRPQDMRAGIQRLASKVAADFGMDLTDELAGAVGIDLSRQVLTRGQIRSIMADVKKPRSQGVPRRKMSLEKGPFSQLSVGERPSLAAKVRL